MADDDAAAPDGELTESSAAEEKSRAEVVHGIDAEEAESADEADDKADEAGKKAKKARQPWSHLRVAAIVGVISVLALGGVAGWLGYRAYDAYQAERGRDLFLQVGRQGARRAARAGLGDRNVLRRFPESRGTVHCGRQTGAVQNSGHNR